MVRSLFNYKNPFIWIIIHIGIGVVSVFSPFPLIVFFYLFFILSIPYIFEKEKINSKLAFIIVYLSSFEIISRMAKSSPYIPYELGKYLMMFLLILGLFKNKQHKIIGILLFLLLLPSFFYDYSGFVDNSDIRFNVFGAINIGLAVWYFYGKEFTPRGFKLIIILLVLPLISSLSYTIIKTPDLASIDFNLGANFETTGGFGSNQVATVFGFGMLITFYLWLNKISLSGNKYFDLIFFILFTFQGLLSFSRGGIIGGVVGILIVIYFLTRSSVSSLDNANINQVKKFFLPGILFLGMSAFTANYLTNGLLLLRYQGETEGTLAGSKVKTLNTLSSDRISIVESDLELLFDYGLLGVGAGASKYLREDHRGVVAHVEASRLIAEHGIFGILFIVLIFYLFWVVYRMKNKNIFKGLLFSFLFLGWFTTFHAATRTYITPLLIGISLIQVVNEKKSTLPR
jgi:hypothetical protein